MEGEHAPVAFRPHAGDYLTPSGAKARFDANVDAIRVANRLASEGRPATPDEQVILSRFSSWGAVPDVFDESKANWSTERSLLQSILSEEAYSQARRTTINAHYTDTAYVEAIWSTMRTLGFQGGTVLEPGAGSGTFIGMAPVDARMVGVELDQTSATIAAALYPGAEIRAESFADTKLPEGYFDAAVGNVPFGNVQLHDPIHNAGRHSLHNHFIIKSLALTRPGGLVAVLTSSYTMDAQNPAARREMNKLADLIGAVRLPTGAHRRTAGTEVVTDLLIFRRREVGEPPRSDIWETVSAHKVGESVVKINSYFDTRPEHILGELSVGTGMFGNDTLYVTSDLTTVPERLQRALESVVADARHNGQLMTPRSERSEAQLAAYRPADATLWDGTILAQPDGTFTTVERGSQHPLKVPKTVSVELRHLLRLRDTAKQLLETEAGTREETAELAAARSDLRSQYDAYTAKYGPLNRFTLRNTGRVDPETGEETLARVSPTATRILRSDPFGPVVMALELFDEEKQTAQPAAILTQRVVSTRPEVQGVDTPAEAIAVSLDRLGRIDLPTIAHLLGEEETEARTALGSLVYDDPVSHELVAAAEYLSGDVRVKLDAARQAATEDPAFRPNVEALEKVIPAPLTMEDIQARMGAVWIDEGTHLEFLQEILRDRSLTVENPLPGTWDVRGNRRTILATDEWGTTRRPAPDIAAAVLEQRSLTVYDEIKTSEGTRRVLNPLETQAATEKAEKMQERFSEWVWEDSDRAARLTEEYNRRFNSIVLRDYTDAGDYLTFPGMSATFNPRAHQRAAVARMIAEPAVGLFHEVGAGKTAEMVMGATELKRMGLITKPVVVVPNHMLEQFAREWLQIYPQARILAASSDDLTGDKRRLFVARAAANDWDAIIATRTAFERLPVSPDFEQEYIQSAVDELRAVVESSQAEDRLTTKQLEKKLLRLEEKQKAMIDRPRDPGITFDSTGIDYVIVDEAHEYKNLSTDSNIDGASIAGAGKATDLHMKLEYLRHRHGGRVATLATATPIANSVTEAHVMQRYLRPDLLRDAGVHNFDAWAATFGQTVTEMEMAPTGGGNFRLKTRFAKFQNVPEMLRMWHVFADVKTAEDLNLPTPDLRERPDGQRLPVTHVLAPTPLLQRYIENIAERADQVANKMVKPEVDNMLKISTDGRKAALDMRMVGFDEQTDQNKLTAVASQILTIWEANRGNRYTDTVSGQLSEVPGALQLVFSDLGTPDPQRWDAYNELKSLLVAGGMPADQVRFIHQAKNDAEKGRLFAAARAGHVAVLLGSTQKMGVGTNVQARAIALHHVDCPWRPADIQQRDGRIVRQGNQNSEVEIHRYVVEGSFDAYMWQAVERKAKFIAQIMRGKLDVREMDDIGDVALSAAETKALSSGNPLLLEQALARDEVAKLQRLNRAHSRSQRNMIDQKKSATGRLDAIDRNISELEAAIPKGRPTDGEHFAATIDGQTVTKRTDAADALQSWANRNYITSLPSYTDRKLGTMAEIGGYTINARAQYSTLGLQIVAEVSDAPVAAIAVTRDSFTKGMSGMVTRLENLANSLPRLLDEQKQRRSEALETIAEAEQRIGRPFKYADELQAAQERLDRVEVDLAALAAADAREGAERAQTPDVPTKPHAGVASGNHLPNSPHTTGPTRPAGSRFSR
ncbi:MAG: DEAD/DEAH box helicase family protein [Actinobacteria bacterium]|nr:DEAD/DEAH box helicase family protein [Actinomycetota bacterium]